MLSFFPAKQEGQSVQRINIWKVHRAARIIPAMEDFGKD